MITIAATSRFHYEKLALELDSRDLLYRWLTSMPQSKILSIKRNKINSFLAPLLLNYIASTFFRDQFFLRSFIEDNANHLFDLYCLNQVSHSSSRALIGLSHNICLAGIAAKKNNKLFICDVPIAHPEYLNEVLSSEYQCLGLPFKPISSKQIKRESKAHLESDLIVAPSSFVKKTLINHNVPSDKIHVVPYGCSVLLDTENVEDSYKEKYSNESFNILFVGQVTPRKGIHYLLRAFERFKHPNKHLTIVGSITQISRKILAMFDLSNVSVVGTCNKKQLHYHYSKSHVFVLPSLAEGLALVIGEALAYGLPIIYTENTGARSILSNNLEGLEVRPRSSDDIVFALEKLSCDHNLLHAMSDQALVRANNVGSWVNYGDKIASLVSSYQ